MRATLLTAAFVILAGSTDGPACCRKDHKPDGEDSRLKEVLKKLDDTAVEVRSYRCGIAYRFEQPLFESSTTRRGNFFYAAEDDRRDVRVSFQTLQQDDGQARAYREEFVFADACLTHVNYHLEQVKRYRPNESEDPSAGAAGMAGGFLPLLGLGGVKDLTRQFEIELSRDAEPASVLLLKPRPRSSYESDFTLVTVRVNSETGLPDLITALTTEEDIYRIELSDPAVNGPLEEGVFAPDIPGNFTVTEMKGTGNG